VAPQVQIETQLADILEPNAKKEVLEGNAQEEY